MADESIAPNISLEEFDLQMSLELPTGQVIHDEIGVSWEVIAAEVYFCSRNDVKKYAGFLPKVFYTANQMEAATAVLAVWDKVISAYQESLFHQEQRRADVGKRWKRERPRYARALNYAARFDHLSEDELGYIREQTGEADYTPVYDGEYNKLDMAYDEIAHNNKQILLGRIKPVLEKLPIEQSRKLAAFYGGYTALAYAPFVACVSILSEDAKQRLKEEIDSMTANTKEQFQRAIYHSKALVDCAGICQNDSEGLRGGQKTVWNSFEEKTKGALYRHALRMAALVLVFRVWEWSKYELEMFMEYALFLDGIKQTEILERTKGLLFAGEVQPSHTLEEIRPFISEMMGEQELLEHYFGLEIANDVYD